MKAFLKKFWWIILIVLAVGGFFLVRTTAGANKNPKIKTQTVVRKNLTDSLSLSGKIDANEKVSLRFQTSGLLAWVGVKNGDTVRKWQAVASLDKRDLQISMKKYLNTFSSTRADFEQAWEDNQDFETNGMTDEARNTIRRSLSKYQNDLNNSVLNVEAADLALKYATLVSPIEGVVTNVDTPLAGQNVTPAQATIDIVNPKTIYFSATADQTEITKFYAGLTGKVVLDSFPDEEYDALVESVAFSPKAGESGTVYELKIAIEAVNDRQQLKLGMTGDASFVFRRIENVLVVPSSYIKEEGDKKYVWKQNGKAKEKVYVTVGLSIDGETEISSGLNEKDIVFSN